DFCQCVKPMPLAMPALQSSLGLGQVVRMAETSSGGTSLMRKLTQSYVHGTSDVPLIGETIGIHFDKAAARWGERDALIVRHQDVRWSYAELQRRIDAFAAGLLALGLEPGDRIGTWSPNNAEWVVTQFATAKAGLILVNITPA